MSQFPAQPIAGIAYQPPPIPAAPPLQGGPVSVFPRGPIGGPMFPYQPGTFGTLYLWWAILAGLGLIPVLGFPMLIAGIVLGCIMLYRFWNQIQDGHQRTSPGKAIGFLFIPFFNLYWVFVAVQGLSMDLNAYLRRYGVNVPAVSETLALTYCILFIVIHIMLVIWPFAYIASIAQFVIACVLWHQVKLANMAIAQAKLNAAAQAGFFRTA